MVLPFLFVFVVAVMFWSGCAAYGWLFHARKEHQGRPALARRMAVALLQLDQELSTNLKADLAGANADFPGLSEDEFFRLAVHLVQANLVFLSNLDESLQRRILKQYHCDKILARAARHPATTATRVEARVVAARLASQNVLRTESLLRSAVAESEAAPTANVVRKQNG